MKKNKLILAGSGYLGSYLIKLLNEDDRYQEVIELARSATKQSDKTIRIIRDFDSKEMDLRCINGGEVVYMAPPNNNGTEDKRLSNFIRNIKNHNIRKFLYISTSGVYGNCNGELVDELRKPRPQTDRAKRRLDAERQLTNYCHSKKIKLIILRTPGIYGKGRLPIDKIKNGEPVIQKKESRVTNLIHVEDLARVTLAALDNDKLMVIEIINVSDGNPITSTEYYETICELIGIKNMMYISYKEAQNIYTDKRLSFLNESRMLSAEKMFRLFPNCIKYRDLKKGVEYSLDSQT